VSNQPPQPPQLPPGGWGPPPQGAPTQPQWGQQPPQPPPKKPPGPFRIGLLGCLGVIVALVVVGIVVTVIAGGGSDTETFDAPATPEGQPAATSTDTSGRKAGVVLLQAKGTGNGNTKQFTSAGDWDLIWAVKCDGDGYVSIDPKGDEFLIGPTVDKTAKGTEHYHEGGKYHFTVIGGPNCSWTVKAVTA
jgi:hypothetical protein